MDKKEREERDRYRDLTLAVLSSIKVRVEKSSTLKCSKCDIYIQEDGEGAKAEASLLRMAFDMGWTVIKEQCGCDHVDDTWTVNKVVCSACAKNPTRKRAKVRMM